MNRVNQPGIRHILLTACIAAGLLPVAVQAQRTDRQTSASGNGKSEIPASDYFDDQEKPGEGKKNQRKAASKKKQYTLPPSTVFLTYGYGKKLKGYYDPLYVGGDKSDYLSTPNHDMGLEFAVPFNASADVTQHLGSTDDIDYFQFGGSIKVHGNEQSSRKVIPRVTGYNSYRKVIQQNDDKATQVGFFLGVTARDWSIEPGLTFSTPIIYEQSRQRRSEEDPSRIEKVPGRGLLISNIEVLPNAKIRLGSEDSLHFKVMVLREQYNYSFDALQSALSMPFGNTFAMEYGLGIVPVGSLFLKPIIKLGEFLEVHLKGSMALHHYNENLQTIGLQDAAFFNAGLKALF